MNYEIQIGEVTDFESLQSRPKHTFIITESQFEVIRTFADVVKDEELNEVYVINKCRFKVVPIFTPNDFKK